MLRRLVLVFALGASTAALGTPRASPGAGGYLAARLAIAQRELAKATALVSRLAGRERAEAAWYLAHARHSPEAIATTAAKLCAEGDPTGRACADAELYGRPLPPREVVLAADARLPLSTTAPFPLMRGEAGGVSTAFVVDTGASQSVVSSALAAKLGLVTTKAAFPIGIAGGGRALAHLAVLPTLAAGSLTVRGLPVLVVDLDDLDRIGISGILSPQQAFDGLVARIDTGAHELVLSKETPRPSSRRTTTVPYLFAGFDLAVEASIGGGPRGLFGLDTGLAGAYAVRPDYRAQAKPIASNGGSIALHGAGGGGEARTVDPLPVSVGALELSPHGDCIEAPLAKADALGLEGLLGNGLWSGGALTLDTRAREVTIELPDAPPHAGGPRTP